MAVFICCFHLKSQATLNPLGGRSLIKLGFPKSQMPLCDEDVPEFSLFCLQPQVDSYTRRSAFDSMLPGCILVFFPPYTQYTQLKSEDDVSIEERLVEIPAEQVKVIYADPRTKLETLKDAFRLSVQRLSPFIIGKFALLVKANDLIHT